MSRSKTRDLVTVFAANPSILTARQNAPSVSNDRLKRIVTSKKDTLKLKSQVNITDGTANGCILHESIDLVVIATGFKAKSTNEKTGGMIQIYILHRTLHPMEAVKTGADFVVCGNCQHRKDANGKRRCYVQIAKGPSSVWQCYQRGGYARAALSEIPAIFADRLVRFGAYGDPAFIPREIVESIARAARRWTGYSHQWQNPEFSWLKSYVMASCDSELEAYQACSDGWRYFRVARFGDSTRVSDEISCPASKEAGKHTTCEKCCLCNGSKGSSDARKNIVIQDHSVIRKSTPLIQIEVK
jgi:hypothetical protein